MNFELVMSTLKYFLEPAPILKSTSRVSRYDVIEDLRQEMFLTLIDLTPPFDETLLIVVQTWIGH